MLSRRELRGALTTEMGKQRVPQRQPRHPPGLRSWDRSPTLPGRPPRPSASTAPRVPVTSGCSNTSSPPPCAGPSTRPLSGPPSCPVEAADSMRARLPLRGNDLLRVRGGWLLLRRPTWPGRGPCFHPQSRQGPTVIRLSAPQTQLSSLTSVWPPTHPPAPAAGPRSAPPPRSPRQDPTPVPSLPHPEPGPTRPGQPATPWAPGP